MMVDIPTGFGVGDDDIPMAQGDIPADGFVATPR